MKLPPTRIQAAGGRSRTLCRMVVFAAAWTGLPPSIVTSTTLGPSPEGYPLGTIPFAIPEWPTPTRTLARPGTPNL